MIKIYKKAKDVPYNETDVFLHFTGNIFGIGCSTFNDEAIKKIMTLKGRNEKKGFIVLFASLEQAKKYQLPQLRSKKIVSFLGQYLPGNLTTLLEIDNRQFTNVCMFNKIAFRIPRTRVLREFINRIGAPVLSTSINVAGQPFCSDLNTLHKDYSDWFDYGLYDPSEPAESPIPSTIIEFDETWKKLKFLREGSIPFAEIEESWNKPLIQFVCVGNICRSPLAEYYVRGRLIKEEMPFETASSGLLEGRRMISEHSKYILDSNQIPVKNRASVTIDAATVSRSMLLICMSKDIKDDLIKKYPEASEKAFTFAEFTDNKADIDDPYGLEAEAYNKAWNLIRQYTEPLLKKLKEMY